MSKTLGTEIKDFLKKNLKIFLKPPYYGRFECGEEDSNPRRHEPLALKASPFGRSGIPTCDFEFVIGYKFYCSQC